MEIPRRIRWERRKKSERVRDEARRLDEVFKRVNNRLCKNDFKEKTDKHSKD